MSDTGNDNSQELDLISLFKTIWHQRRKVVKWAIYGAIFGLIVAFSISSEYTSLMKLAPEGSTKNTSSSNMSSLAALAGMNIGSSSDGINLQIYPDIVQSIAFVGELSQITVNSKGRDVTLYEYIDNDIKRPWWNAVISFPFKALGWVMSIFKEKPAEADRFDIMNLSREQYKVIYSIKDRIDINVDNKTNIITLSARMQDPKIAAMVTDSLSEMLQRHVITYQTDKARRDLEFTQQLYSDTQAEYYRTQEQYAEYMDNSQNTVRESIKAKQERYRNEQTLAFNVYSQLAQQLETAKINLQDKTPVATIIEPAIVPVMKSGMGKSTILIIWIFLGALIAIGIITVQELFLKKE